MNAELNDNIHTDKHCLKTSILAALEAGREILGIYRTDFTVKYKEDSSPLTLADRASHHVITEHLIGFGIPILSEEGKNVSFRERNSWRDFWMIDPLDGTKEFIKKNGEFTVNIARIREGKPDMGVVFAPDQDLLYFGLKEAGAFKIAGGPVLQDLLEKIQHNAISMEDIMKSAMKLPFTAKKDRPYIIVGSRSHATPELERFVEEKRRRFQNLEFIPAGSSLKLCLVAEGVADIYPRLAPTMEWDTAAGHAVVESAGARIFAYETGDPLTYNKENLLNPWFVVERPKMKKYRDFF